MQYQFITRTEYESRHSELKSETTQLFHAVDEINQKLDTIKIGWWKLIAVSALNFITGSGITLLIELLRR